MFWLPICRPQKLDSTAERMDEFVNWRVVDFRRSMFIQPATRFAKSTRRALGEENVVVAFVSTVAEVYLTPYDQARILKQVGHIGPERARIATGFTCHNFTLAATLL